MTKEQFKNQMIYSAAVRELRIMLPGNIITEDEFKKAEKALREKYRPIIIFAPLY